MDVDKAIASVERYLRQFVVFILSFFRRDQEAESDDSYDDLNNTIVFSVMGAFVGAYMWTRYVNFVPHAEVMKGGERAIIYLTKHA